MQLEEKVNRLEQEKEELMAVIQKGEGSDTAIHQLQQENVFIPSKIELNE